MTNRCQYRTATATATAYDTAIATATIITTDTSTATATDTIIFCLLSLQSFLAHIQMNLLARNGHRNAARPPLKHLLTEI